MKQLLTTDDVIGALGGPTATGRLVSRSAQAVNHWRVKNLGKFPAWTFMVLQAELKRKGFSAPLTLWGMEVPQRRSA